METVRRIKGLKSQIKNLEADSSVLKEEIKIKQRELSEKSKAIIKLQETIKDLCRRQGDETIRVTEHAVIRYMERVQEFDINKIKALILDDDLVNLIVEFKGNGKFPLRDEASVIVKDYTITTII